MVTTKHFTATDLWNLGSAAEDYELIEGELIEVVPPRHGHGKLQLKIGSLLLRFVESRGLGEVVTEAGYIFARDPDTVLGPDVSFVSNDRLATESEPWSELPPDLAIEVVSPGNTRAEIDRKVRIYLDSGVQLVWIVRPDARTITVHLPGSPPQTLTDRDTLTGGDVLPGFTVQVAEVFGK